MNRIDKFEAFLKEQDAISLPYRAERLRFLVETYGEPRYQLLSYMASHYLEEAKLCYLNGTYTSCILIVQAALEDILRHFYRLMGNDKLANKSGFKELIEESVKKRFIIEEEADAMNHVRNLRNPYVHTKGPMHQSGFIRRAQESNFEKDDWDLMKEDAEDAIRCLFALIKRRPFSFYEEE